MSDDNPREQRPDDAPADDRSWTWFGPPREGQPSSSPTAPPAVGDWPTPDPPAPRGPAFDPQPGWAPPTGPPFGYPGPPSEPAPVAAAALPVPTRRGGPRGGAVVAVAALTALVIGGAAGFGGSRLAVRTEAAAPAIPSSAPSTPDDPVPTQPGTSPLPPPPAQADTVEIAKRVLPGTVMIQTGSSTGSGFVMDTAGRIMTNNHVVAGAADGGRIRVVFADGRRLNATLVGRSPSYDLAVVKVRGSDDLQPLPVGDSDAVEVGQPVLAVGSPLGLPGTVTQGIVSARDRPVVVNAGADADAPTAYINAIQTDAPINPGNSGGPLIDAGGRVIGVNSAILTLGARQGQTGNIGLGFAIPVNQARQIGQQLSRDGKASYPVIGATVSDTENGSGVEITTVEDGGPAAEAGLRPGDRVDQVDGRPVTTMEELIVEIRTHRPGQEVVLDYTRGSSDRTATVELGSKEG